MSTVAERLAGFVRGQLAAGLPDEPRHEARRLLLNQLKASVGATDQAVVRMLAADAPAAPASGSARMIWLGRASTPEAAAMVNGALFEVLDFSDTYIPTFMHAVSGVLPVVLAAAEALGSPGSLVIDALALGIETEIACAEIVMPSGYTERGFIPLGLVGGIGGAVAYSILAGLTEEQTVNAIAVAMATAGGCYVLAGSMGLPYVTAVTARNALTAGRLARAGLLAPAAAFEGDKGMLQAYSNEPADRIDASLDQLGTRWRIHGQSYKTMPTETITHGPLECTLALRARSAGRELDRLTVGVSPIVVKIADERRNQFGLPSTELEAKFDIRHCVAAAWQRGRFTLAEMLPSAFTDPTVVALRERLDLVPDDQQETFDGAWAQARYTDGASDRIDLPVFTGTVARPLTDSELVDVFRSAATGLLAPERTEEVARAVWTLDDAGSIDPLMDLLVVDK